MVSGGTDDSLRLQVIDVINGAETKREGERDGNKSIVGTEQ